jgi:RF-1 domain
MVDLTRSSWTCLNDGELLAQCELDTYRASGPGGQKRNKTSSAVRIRHPPSGLIVIAEESRSQHENRERGLRRLRQAFYLKLREPIPSAGTPATLPAIQECRTGAGRLVVGKKDQRLWPAVGILLDVLEARQARVSEAAELLEISTANLIEFLGLHPKVWEQVQHMRGRFGLKQLRMD